LKNALIENYKLSLGKWKFACVGRASGEAETEVSVGFRREAVKQNSPGLQAWESSIEIRPESATDGNG